MDLLGETPVGFKCGKVILALEKHFSGFQALGSEIQILQGAQLLSDKLRRQIQKP